MSQPQRTSREEWLAAREALVEKESALRSAREELSARCRMLPMVRVEQNHMFEGANGKVSLTELFERRRQLVIYHFWFPPGDAPCEGCSLWASDLGDLGGSYANLHEHDTSLAFVSRATPQEIEAVRTRRNWTMPWYSVVGEDFHELTGYDGWAQLSIFVREGEDAYLANIVPMRDLATIGNHWTILERCPLGLKEN